MRGLNGQILRKIGKRGTPRPAWFRLQEASLIGGAGFQPDAPAVPGDPKGGSCAVMEAKRLQFPAGSGQHVDSAVAAHQNGQFAVLTAALTGGVKHRFGIFQKGAHAVLIVCIPGILNVLERLMPGEASFKLREVWPTREIDRHRLWLRPFP